jgi:hypothetical protein
MHEDIRNTSKMLVENFKGREHLVDSGLDGSLIFKWIIMK